MTTESCVRLPVGELVLRLPESLHAHLVVLAEQMENDLTAYIAAIIGLAALQEPA